MTELAQLIQTAGYGEVQETLQFLLEECSLDQAPDREEIAQHLFTQTRQGDPFDALADMAGSGIALYLARRAYQHYNRQPENNSV